jgi:inhibitor of KinA
MKKFEVKYKPFGEAALLIEWPSEMNQEILKDILHFNHKITSANKKYVLETIQSINSITIIYQSDLIDYKSVESEIAQLYIKDTQSNNDNPFQKWKIPVCYDLSYGLDLKDMALLKGLTVSQIIELHSNASYLIYAIGFLPGFLYLGGLSEALHTPRKSEPRLRISQGAVGIGGSQTGIYPNDSPGGWHIIGNTPVSFFDIAKESPCFAKPGDTIEFIPITKEEHNSIQEQVRIGIYEIGSEVMHA